MKDLFKIAKTVRKQAYNKAHKYYGEELTGYCARGSAMLWTALVKAGLSPVICLARSQDGDHVFVMCENYIVDVTATQFGERPVCIKRFGRGGLQPPWYWRCFKTFNDPNSLKQCQIEEDWPKDEIVI